MVLAYVSRKEADLRRWKHIQLKRCLCGCVQVFQLTHDLRYLESQEVQMRHAADAFQPNQRGPQFDGPPQRYGGRKYGGGPMKMGGVDNRGPRRSGPSPSHDSSKRTRRS